MNVIGLIVDLLAVPLEADVVIEEEGLGYAGDLLNVNTVLTQGDRTTVTLLARASGDQPLGERAGAALAKIREVLADFTPFEPQYSDDGDWKEAEMAADEELAYHRRCTDLLTRVAQVLAA